VAAIGGRRSTVAPAWASDCCRFPAPDETQIAPGLFRQSPIKKFHKGPAVGEADPAGRSGGWPSDNLRRIFLARNTLQ